MPEQTDKIPNPQVEDAAKAAVAQTKRVLASMVERIFDSQRKLGVWESDEGDPETEDIVGFLMDIQAKVTGAYHAFTAGEPEFPRIMIGAAIELLGAARRCGIDVGEAFVDGVIEQAGIATAAEKEDLAMIASSDVEGIEAAGSASEE